MTGAPISNAKPRVLVVTSTFPRWASDTDPGFVLELCKRLLPDFDIRVLAPRAPGTARREIMDGVTVHRYSYFLSRWEILTNEGGILAKIKKNRILYGLLPFFFLGQWLAIRTQLREWQPRLVHAHWLIPQGAIAALSGMHSTPLVCTSHGGDLHGLQGRGWNRVRNWVKRHCAALIVVSQAMKVEFMKRHDHGPSEISVISMGVDAQGAFTPSPNYRRNGGELLFVGRLVKGKGLNILLEAMPRIIRERPDVLLRVVGSGPEEGNLQQLSAALGTSRHVQFQGAIPHDHLPAYYQRATLFVAPYVEQEGFGLVNAEALACGCPVVASSIPAVGEIIVDGETGLLAKPGDSDDLAEKILLLLSQDGLRQKLADAGRQHVLSHFDWTRIAGQHAELFHQLIEARTLSR